MLILCRENESQALAPPGGRSKLRSGETRPLKSSRANCGRYSSSFRRASIPVERRVATRRAAKQTFRRNVVHLAFIITDVHHSSNTFTRISPGHFSSGRILTTGCFVSTPLSRGKRGLQVSGSFLFTSDDKKSEDFRSQKFGKNQVISRDFPGGITRAVRVPKGPRGSFKPKKDGSIGLILSVCIPKMKFYDDKIVSGENENR